MHSWRYKSIMQILSVVGYKGGSGKTTVAVNLADVLGERMPVVLLDTDPQASASAWIGNVDHVRVEHIPRARELGQVLSQSWRGLAIIDCRPGDPELTSTAIAHADLVLLPLRPSPLDLHANGPIIEQLSGGGAEGLAVITQATPRTHDADQMRAVLVEQYHLRVARSVIHNRIAMTRAPLWEQGICDLDPGGPAAAEILELADEVGKVMRL